MINRSMLLEACLKKRLVIMTGKAIPHVIVKVVNVADKQQTQRSDQSLESAENLSKEETCDRDGDGNPHVTVKYI